MAVSVRTAYSMPHLHPVDFDLSPRSHYNGEPRWGNSSPVLILSLLEIVERENDVHIQEAAPRLKPGWVRNACAAFEQGMDFSKFEKLNNVQNGNGVRKKMPHVVEENNSQGKPKPKGCTSRAGDRICSSALPKSRSLESFDSQKRDSDIVVKDVKKDFISSETYTPCVEESQDSSFCSVRKKNIPKLKRSKSASDKSLPWTKLKVSASTNSHGREVTHRQVTTKPDRPGEVAQGTSSCRIHSDKTRHQLQILPNKLRSSSTSDSVRASRIPEYKRPSTWSSQENAVVHGRCSPCSAREEFQSNLPKAALSVDLVKADGTDVTGAGALCQSTDDPHVDDSLPAPPSDGDLSEVYTASKSQDPLFATRKEGGMTSGGENQDIPSKFDIASSAVEKADKLQDHQFLLESSTDSPPLRESEESEPLPDNSMPSVRPKDSVNCGNKMEPASGVGNSRNFVVCEGAVSVCIKSSACVTDRRKHSFKSVPQDGEVSRANMSQSAMGQSATSKVSADSLPAINKSSDLVVMGKKLCPVSDEVVMVSSPSTSTSDTDEISVMCQEKSKYPRESVEAFLLSKDSNKYDFRLELFRARYTSYRHLSISPRKFTSSIDLPVCKEMDRAQTSSDHLANLKRAFEKKWSRPNVQIAKRGSKNFNSLDFQVRNHPLAYHDPYESEESDTESEEEWHDDVMTHFRHVPTYIIAKIFRHLQTRDLAALKCTCKDFNWLINHFDIVGTDSKWVSGEAYRNDPCMHCGKIQDPRGDVSLCRRHPKIFYKYSHIGRCYWTCCNAVDRDTVGCQVGLHNNKWTTANFKPCFICKPWRSMSWYATANYDRWCDKEHL